MLIIWAASIAIHQIWTTEGLHTGAQMGVADFTCDDAQTNLTVDWPDFHFSEFTCSSGPIFVNETVIPIYYEIPNLDPTTDVVYHACMDETLVYNDTPPLRGNHRPNWAKFGEYLYLPPQRWLHNLEHGSVIMLYHPCSHPDEVNKLRTLVNSCLYRHIITPYQKLSIERPLALVTWGHKLEMNSVNVETALAFMRNNARRAPEDLSRQGMYDLYQTQEAQVVTDQDDTVICAWADKYVDSSVEPSVDPKGTYEGYKSTPFANREKRQQIAADPNYDRIYMDQLKHSNGPKFANDVLPPSAIWQQYNVPHYVMAGSFLGADPRHPKTSSEGNNFFLQLFCT